MRILIFDTEHRQAREVEYRGFFQGAQGVSPENGKAEIEASFERRTNETKQQSLLRKKKLEGHCEFLTSQAATVIETWRSIQAAIRPEDLKVAMPIVVAILAAAAIATEVELLAPSLDLLDIADPTMQLIGAFGLAALASVVLHLAWDTTESNTQTTSWRVTWRVLGVMSAVALVLWGILRGYQVAFAADVNGNQLGTFLAGHTVLASVFYVFITLGAPVVAAGALSYASRHLRDWYRYRRAERHNNKVTRELSHTKKQIEAETEWLKHEITRLEHERREQVHAFLEEHERGQKNGARQSPAQLVHVKATLSLVLTLLFCWWMFALSPFSFLFPAAAYVAAFLYFRHQRIHPTPAEFYDLERVHFVERTDDAEAADQFLPGPISLKNLKELSEIPKLKG